MKKPEIYPIAKLADLLLVINKSDVTKLGNPRKQATVKAIKIDTTKRVINEPHPLELHLKFNPWEEILDLKERNSYISMLLSLFSKNEILDIEKQLSL
ncbi:hypothetical protein KC721_04190 [Candidatus Woesebacteria bacterium]|nr:hypothetical protein [Candidatus Woesebacteria bacterium]